MKSETEVINSNENPVEVNLTPFYIVSLKKFVVLNVLTLGLYSIVWLYKHWEKQNKAGFEPVSPFWRAVFSIFFYHSLTERIKNQSQVDEVVTKWDARLTATLVVVFTIISQIFDRLSSYQERQGQDGGTADLISWIAVFAAYYFEWQIQKNINLGFGDKSGLSNDKITGNNWLWVGVFWLIFAVGVVVGTTPYFQ